MVMMDVRKKNGSSRERERGKTVDVSVFNYNTFDEPINQDRSPFEMMPFILLNVQNVRGIFSYAFRAGKRKL